MKKPKPIHLIIIKYGHECNAICDTCIHVMPLEAIIKRPYRWCIPKGTFNPKKVTCKRCLQHLLYKEALEKVNNPLFYWKERT